MFVMLLLVYRIYRHTKKSQLVCYLLDIEICILARIAVHEEGECLPNTRRSRLSLNDDPSLCATLYTVGGVGELYQRRSILR